MFHGKKKSFQIPNKQTKSWSKKTEEFFLMTLNKYCNKKIDLLSCNKLL